MHERQCSLNQPAVSIVEYCLCVCVSVWQPERYINRLESSSACSAILLHSILCCTSCGILSVNAICNTNDFRKYSQCSSDNRVLLLKISNSTFQTRFVCNICLPHCVLNNVDSIFMAVCFVAKQHETIYSNSCDQMAEPLSIAYSHTNKHSFRLRSTEEIIKCLSNAYHATTNGVVVVVVDAVAVYYCVAVVVVVVDA